MPIVSHLDRDCYTVITITIITAIVATTSVVTRLTLTLFLEKTPGRFWKSE